MKKVKLSILIPVYKENEDILQYLLDSIKLQQGVNRNDFEVIIGHDGNPDGYIIDDDLIDYYDQFFNIKYLCFSHGGVSATRNLLMNEACGEYIQFCDCDDMFSSSLGLRLIMQEIDNKHFDIMYSSFTEEVYNKEKQRKEYVIHNNDCTFVHGKVVRKQFLLDNNIRWNEKLTLHEDGYFFALCYYICDKNKIDIVDKPFYLWKWREDSVVRKDDNFILKTYTDLLDSNEALIEEFVRRDMKHEAAKFMFLDTFSLYYNMNEDLYKKEENQEYVVKIETRFKDIYNKYVDLMDLLTAEEQLKLTATLRHRAAEEGLVLEYITFNDWIKRVLER